MKEQAIVFGTSNSLVGILNHPHSKPYGEETPAIILLNSGIIHRVGPGRLYVKLARLMANLGFRVLRFDLSAIGDSLTRRDTLTFKKSAPLETTEAMDFLAERFAIKRFILMGICTGAVVSYDTALMDGRVVGALLINAQGFMPDSDQQTKQYIGDRKNANYYFAVAALNAGSWKKLFTGQADYGSIFRALVGRLSGRRGTQTSRSSEVSKVEEGFNKLSEQGTELLFLYSEGDPGIDELDLIFAGNIGRLVENENVQYRIVKQTDHLFTPVSKQEEFLAICNHWLDAVANKRSPR